MRRPKLFAGLLGLLLSSLTLPAAAQVGVWHPGGGRAVLEVVPPTPARVSPARRLPPRQALLHQLRLRREQNLARFVAYREAGEFPRNHERPGMLNVFIDAEGHICAAANLMAQDGLLDRVRQVAAQNNFLRLADVHDGPLLAWMLASGFTQEEIATIQEPYDFIEPDIPQEPMFEELEKQRLQARFRQIEAQLRQAEAASLNTAVDRLIAWRQANGFRPFAAVLAQGDLFGAGVPVAQPTPVVVQPVPAPVVQPTPVVQNPGVIVVRRPRPQPVAQPYVLPPPTPVVVQPVHTLLRPTPVVVANPRVRVRVVVR